MPASLEEMFAKQLANPNETLGQQMSYLKDLNYVPKMSLEYLPPGIEGRYNDWEGTLKVNENAGSIINAFAHELQHAVDHARDRQYTQVLHKSDQTAEDRRFLEATKKFNEPTKIPFGDLNSYRSARNERQAYGVANMNYRGGEYRGSSHLDPTEAQEQAIFMDLARQSLKSAPKPKIEPKVDYVDTVLDKPGQFMDWAKKYFAK